MLEDLPRNEDVPKSFCFSPESQCFLLSAGDSDISDSQSNMSCKGSSKYLQKHAFSPSVALENREVADSLFSHCNLQHRDLPVKVTFFPIHYYICKYFSASSVHQVEIELDNK